MGSHVTDTLIQAGHEVTIIDNLSTGKKENINPKANFLLRDIRKPIIGEYDYVFHLAALARIQPSIKDPVLFNDTNVNGTLNVLEYCRSAGAKLIFSSSSSVYRGDIPSNEESPLAPKNPYALQKLICEQYIRLYAELYGLQYAILRYFNVYGPRQILEGAYAPVMGIFLRQQAAGEPLTITNDGEQRRDFTYVEDVARANLMAIDWYGTFNIGTGENYSVNEVAELIGGKKKYIGDVPGEVRETLADNTKAIKKGWKPRGLSRALIG